MTKLGEPCLLLDQAGFLRGLVAQTLKHLRGQYHRPDASGVAGANFVERWARELPDAHALFLQPFLAVVQAVRARTVSKFPSAICLEILQSPLAGSAARPDPRQHFA